MEMEKLLIAEKKLHHLQAVVKSRALADLAKKKIIKSLEKLFCFLIGKLLPIKLHKVAVWRIYCIV